MTTLIVGWVAALGLIGSGPDDRVTAMVRWFRAKQPELVKLPMVRCGDFALEDIAFLVQKNGTVHTLIDPGLQQYKTALTDDEVRLVGYAEVAEAVMKEGPDPTEWALYRRRRRVLLLRTASDALRAGDRVVFAKVATYLTRITPDMFHELKDDFAFFAMRDALYRLSDGALSTQDRIALLEGVENDYPKSAYSEKIRGFVRALDASGERLPRTDDAVSRLIRRLIKQKGGYPRFRRRPQFSIFIDEQSPASQLAKLKGVAVPALVAAIDDDSPTCAVYKVGENKLPRVLRVGECAKLILERIRNRPFTKHHRVRTKKGFKWAPAAVRKEVQEWYRNRFAGNKSVSFQAARDIVCVSIPTLAFGRGRV